MATVAAVTPGRAARTRRRALALVVLLVVVVNLPFAHGWWVGRSIEADGVEVTATVTATRDSGGGLVEFRYDRDVDPEQRTWTAAVDGPGFERAVDDETIRVRVVPGRPERYEVVGESGSGVLVVLTVVADVFLLLALALIWRRRPAGGLRLVALEDVRRARPGGRLEQLDATTYLVVGEVAGVESDAVVLDVGEQQVRVALGDFSNPVGWEQPAQVRACLPDSAP
ncbi:hypothetical protein ABFT23_02800 [Nocardioides sp. C4-1]|uniref:hypothetical protein n=1 Tax=Nocardioides sp. C4-1 TaxID=3151851 RepID=UPI0032648AB3